MKSLDDMMDELSPAQCARVQSRVRELIGVEMAKHGRKSAADLTVVALEVHGRRPPPPAEFTPQENAIWQTISERMPLSALGPECLPVLRALCVHVANCEALEGRLREMRAGLWDMADMAKLLRAYEHHAAAAAELATKLRLTPKSRWKGERAEVEMRNAPGKPLWELPGLKE